MQALKAAFVAGLLTVAASTLGAQEERRRMPDPSNRATPAGIPRNPRFPYVGAWVGTRTLPVGSDQITVRLLVQDDKYKSVIVNPGGAEGPGQVATSSSTGVSWEQPNSGGGTWVYKVHLASPDSLVGTVVLTNPPANLTPAPQGTMVLKRIPAAAGNR